MSGTVISVHCDNAHRFSKPSKPCVRLIEGHGIEGDAHAGRFINHRSQAKKMPEMPNNRQVHLIQAELFDEVKELGFELRPGELGENITTHGIDLLRLPLGTLLYLGRSAVVELTGLRTPCGYIDKFRKGLKRAMIVKTPDGVTFRAGVLGIVRSGGDVGPQDQIEAQLPTIWSSLPAI